MEFANENQIEELLIRISRLLAITSVRGLTQREQITLLNRAGFAPKEIALVLGTTPNAVRVALVSIRRDGPQNRRRQAKIREDKSDA